MLNYSVRRRLQTEQCSPALAAEPHSTLNSPAPLGRNHHGTALAIIQDYSALVYRVCLHWPLYRELLGNVLNKLPANVSNMFGANIIYNPETDVPDLSGKVAIVTGGNAGLGKNSVLEFARHGAKVYMASRTESKARQAIEEIIVQVPNAQIEYLHLDLTSFEGIKQAADEFISKESQLHILLNNAGVMAMAPELTKDGFDIQWGTNHMGHALLTKLLLPTMIKTAQNSAKNSIRVVNVSSEGHRGARLGINFADTALANSSKWTRYAQSKLANILHAKALAKRYSEYGIIAVSCHPGVVFTDLYIPFTSSLGFLGSAIVWPMKRLLTSPEVGSYNEIGLCTSPQVTTEDGGSYYLPVLKKGTPSVYGQDDALADRLWEYTEQQLRDRGY
ncbi:short-chain dehydrogenase/reductase [Tirmania nivea]|nr:short-chain dehydrogenase/reductase [Tirmania nivea]